MLLPSDFAVDAPLLPPLDKIGVTAIATVLLCWSKGTSLPRPQRSALLYILGAVLVLSPIFTSLANSYELQTAGKSVPGFYPLDGIKFAGRNVLMLIPFYIGSRFLSTDNARTQLLRALPLAMLFYSVPMLFEMRMSPQLHRWVYGYFPGDSFAQQMRGGGFRPVVFFPHGLLLAMFTALAVIATFVFVRARLRVTKVPTIGVAAYLSGLLVLCKSLGPVVYAVVFAPMVMFTRPRTWVKLGCVVSLVVCAYPVLREYGLTPTQLVSDLATMVSPERSASFETRVTNEQQLLEKANQKPLVGWGGWGRNRVFDQWTGKDVSITDGGWIIMFGSFGWLGYLSFFGLLAVSLFRALRSMDRQVTPPNMMRGGLAVLLTVYLIDSIPNATQVSLIFLIAGSIASSPPVRVRLKKTPRRSSEPAPDLTAVPA